MTDVKEPQSEEFTRRRSSFFARAHKSFVRGRGNRGASVEILRGTQGASFEGLGKISRGNQGLCGCCFGDSESTKDRFFLIKGPFCFVFGKIDDPSPKYAVGLQSTKAVLKNKTGPAVVVLENELGDVDFEFSFADMETAKQFKTAVDRESASAQVEEVRKRLGHEHLITKRSSLVYAETIAKEKVSNQPAAPLSSSEIMSAIPAL